MPDNADKHILLTDEQLRTVIKETVQDTLTRLGMQTAEPLEMQKDFQLLREWRTSTENVKRKGLMLLFTCVFTGIIAAAWMGFKALVKV